MMAFFVQYAAAETSAVITIDEPSCTTADRKSYSSAARCQNHAFLAHRIFPKAQHVNRATCRYAPGWGFWHTRLRATRPQHRSPKRYRMSRRRTRVEDERAIQAFELACAAEETADELERIKLALRAVRLDPYCLDARVIVAEAAGGPEREFIADLQGIVALGERQLEHCFEQDRGHFWGVVETRPYMRARARLAEEFHKAGRIHEAIQHYKDLMELDERDSLGIRFPLLGCYLQVGDLEGTRKLFKDCDADFSAFFAWGRVLERFLSGDGGGAEAALKEARKLNHFAEALLSGRRRAHGFTPDSYSRGDFSEALVCYEVMGSAWKAHPAAKKWLRQMDGKAK